LEYLTENNLQLLLLFVAPGFISLKIWGLIHPSQKIILSESLIEAIIFSSFNYIVTIWLYFITKNTDLIWIYFIIALIIFPIIWPILFKRLLNTRLLKNKTISLIPKSWDYFFSKRKYCFMLIHLNSDRVIGGLYGFDSFTSSYPEKEDVYLQEVWKVDKEGKFIEKVPDTKGLLINNDVIEYIELFEINGEDKGNG
jgi:hypothetical protein